jgi:hypothetical protein
MAKRGQNYHVVRHGDGWAARRENASRVSSQHQTQREAIEAGRRLAQQTRGELRIHGRDGKIRDTDSYGNDPNPPKDTKN